MTNQTIDGVPGLRALLERLHSEHVSMAGPGFWAAWKELRGLLNAPACGTPVGLDCPGDGVGQCKKCPATQPEDDTVAVAAHWSDWSMLTLEIDGQYRTYVETGKPEAWDVIVQQSKQLGRLKKRAWAIMQEAIDGARVHPCDEHSEEVKVRTLAPIYQDLYASLTATGEQPASAATETIPAPRALLERVETWIPDHCQDLTDLQALLQVHAEQQVEPFAQPLSKQVPFCMLSYGAKFKYTPDEAAVWVKIGQDLVAGWDAAKVADGWSGQPVCSFADDGNLLAPVALVPDQPAPVEVVPDGYCIMPRKLTAENGAKALLLGEFKLQVTMECPECCELDEPTEGCSICDGEGEYGQKHTIPWDQIKFIYSKAVSGLADVTRLNTVKVIK